MGQLMADEGGFDVYPIPLDRYVEPDFSLEAQAEADLTTDLLAHYGGFVRSWDVPSEKRDLSATMGRLDEWATAKRSSLLLWLGHGRTVGGAGRLVVPDFARGDELVSPDVLLDRLRKLRNRTARQMWTVVVIEACGAGAVVDDIWDQLDRDLRAGVVLIGSGEAGGNGYLGSFRRALAEMRRSEDSRRDFSHDSDIGLEQFAGHFKRHLPNTASVPYGQVRGVAPFASRPAAIPRLTLPVSVYAELRRRFDQLPAAVRPRLPDLATLMEFSGPRVGRSTEAAAIAEFLRAAAGGLLVVTGMPGSGKSALLSSILVAAHEDTRRALGELGLDLPGLNGPVMVSGALPLTGASLHDVINAVADIAGVPRPAGLQDAGKLIESLGGRAEPLTLVIDALDESADPLAIAALLRELGAAGRVSLVVGTRRYPTPDTDSPADDLLAALGVPDDRVLELRQDTTAMLAFARDRLRADPQFRAARNGNELDDAARIAEAIIAPAAGDFLHARLLVEEILADAAMPLDGSKFSRLMELDRDEAFAAVLARITEQCPAALPALRALALAGGRGVPREGVWEAMASALALDEGTHGLSESDLDEVLDVARAYVMLDYVDGVNVYRLAHRVFRDHLVAGLGEAATSGELDVKMARALLDLALGQAELVPYLRRYLPWHLARLGTLGWSLLAAAPEVLDQMDLPALVTAAHAAPGGLASLPGPVVGAVVTSHLAADSGPADRLGLRQVGMARAGHRWEPSRPAPGMAWTVTEARIRPQRVKLTLPAHHGAVTHLALLEEESTGRRFLASAGEDGAIRLWDPASGWQRRRDVTAHDGPVRALAAMSLGGALLVLASASTDGPLRAVEALTGRELGALPTGATGQVSSAVAYRDGAGIAWFAVTDDKGGIRVLHASPLRLAGERMTGHVGVPVCLTPLRLPGRDGGVRLATGGYDRTVRLWNPEDSQQILPTHNGVPSPVTSICLLEAPAGPELVTGHENGEIHRWHPRRGLLTGGIPGGSRHLVVAALPGGHVAAGGADGVVRVWDLESGQQVGPDGIGHDGAITQILALPGMGRFATAGTDGSIRIWEADSPSDTAGDPPVARQAERERRTWRSALGEAPGWTVLADNDGSLTCTVEGHQPRIFAGLGARTRIALVTDSRLLAAAGNSVVELFDLSDSGPYGTLGHRHDGIGAMAVAQLPRPALVVGDDGGTLRIWDIQDRRLCHEIRLGAGVRSLRADGQRIQVGLDEGEIALELHPGAFTADAVKEGGQR
jgi:WD40 repeat protein